MVILGTSNFYYTNFTLFGWNMMSFHNPHKVQSNEWEYLFGFYKTQWGPHKETLFGWLFVCSLS